jgi:NADPH-dependent glutamate synthase beta subunit-like oxidoreductase
VCEDVTVIYRRSFNEIPAYREEYEEAVEDGVKFHFLTNPERFDADGTVTCRVMELGAPDEKRPPPSIAHRPDHCTEDGCIDHGDWRAGRL